jgi:RND family efflux transporter MFP subunit
MLKTILRPSLFLILLSPGLALADESLTVALRQVSDPKPVFATVESVDIAAARARIGGTLIEMRIDEGDVVTPGQVIAIIGDDKLALQINALEAQIAALAAQQTKAQDDFRRAQELLRSGTIARARLDDAKAAADVAANQLKARQADRAVITQQMSEGQVLSPTAGRVLQVLPTKGAVVMPGDPIARIAADAYILRLQLPERHAQALKVGDVVQLGEDEKSRQGHIRQIYPEITHGRVTADADVTDLGSYFVGQRVRVWINTAQRSTFIIPSTYLLTRAGIDYVRLQQSAGRVRLVPVQRGPDWPDGVEILSGLTVGDILLPAGA